MPSISSAIQSTENSAIFFINPKVNFLKIFSSFQYWVGKNKDFLLNLGPWMA